MDTDALLLMGLSCQPFSVLLVSFLEADMVGGGTSVSHPQCCKVMGQDLTRNCLQPLEKALEVCTWRCAVLNCGQKLGGQSHILGVEHTSRGADSPQAQMPPPPSGNLPLPGTCSEL